MTSLRNKTISGVSWSFFDIIAGNGISFIIGLVLARLLNPSDFGLIGVVSVFLAFSNTFIDSGFSTGLIRKLKCEPIDFDTVFWFNLLMSLLLYFIVFISAPAIASFFEEQTLIKIFRITGVIIILDSFTLVQKTILVRNIDFKTQAIVSLTSSLTSGIVGITLALMGLGVWSIVAQLITRQCLSSATLWLLSFWRPLFRFSRKSFRELFGFGSKILGTHLIQTLQNNIYYFIIGKFFSAASLGYYTRAEQFNSIVTNSLTGTVERVFFPALSSIQDDQTRLKETLRKTLKTSFFITFLALMGLAVTAKPLIHVLIGSKWDLSVEYLQLLCFGSVFFPFNVANLNIMKIKGRSDLILKLQILKTILTIVNILIGIFYGIKIMLLVRIGTSLLATWLNSYFSGKLLDYPISSQLKDIAPYFISEAIILIAMFTISFIRFNNIILLTIEIVTGVILFLVIFETRKHAEYVEIKLMISNLYHNGIKKRFTDVIDCPK